MTSSKKNNDPWLPLDESGIIKDIDDKQFPFSKSNLPMTMSRKLNGTPHDPLHTMIDSQRYIASLETKLEKLKKKENVSSRDIINSLALFQEDQMRHCLNSDSSCFNFNDFNDIDNQQEISSYVKRRLFPELQALNEGEVAALVKEDFIAKAFEELHNEVIDEQGNSQDHM